MRLPGGFVLDLRGHRLQDSTGQALELRPQAFDVLRLLALRPGELVTKDELLAAVWPGLVVTDDSLVQAVGDIRRAFGEAGHRLIRTVPRRGYLLATADDASPSSTLASVPAVSSPNRRWHPPAEAVAALVTAAVAVAGILAWQALTFSAPTDSAGRTPSIAVLPFKAPAPEGEALARDIAASLVSELAAQTCASSPASPALQWPKATRRSPKSAEHCAAAIS